MNSATKKGKLAFKKTDYYSLCYSFTVKQMQITREARTRRKVSNKSGSEPTQKEEISSKSSFTCKAGCYSWKLVSFPFLLLNQKPIQSS